MTVQKDVTKNIYVGNGSSRTFPFTFECPAEHPEYIKVYLMQDDGTALATSDYQLDMDARQITYPSSGTALPEGKKLVIMRELPLQQMMNLVNNGPYFAEDVETAFDENVMAMQQIAEKLNRSIIMSVDIDGDAFVNEVPFEAGKSFRIADDGKSIVLTEDPGKVIDEAKGLAEETATNAQEARQAAAEIKTIYNSGGLTPITDLAGSIGTAIKRWGYIFANKVFAMNLPIVYKSVAEMKADSLLSAGMTACTLGYYSPNDGGAGTYIIRAKADGDVDDGGSLHELAHGNAAELVVENGTVNVKQFGAKGDGVTDDIQAIQNAINDYDNVYIPSGRYSISKSIIIESSNGAYSANGYRGKLITGDEGTKVIICTNDNAVIIRGSHHKLENITFSYNENLYRAFNKALLRIESLNKNKIKRSDNNYFCNIKFVSEYNVYLDSERKFSGIGIQLVSDGSNPTYQNRFSDCNCSDLYIGILIENSSTSGINGNYFDVDLWNCSYFVKCNGNGNYFNGNQQAPVKIKGEKNCCFYITGNYNIFDGFVWDVGAFSDSSTNAAPLAYVTGRNNDFRMPFLYNDAVAPFSAYASNKFCRLCVPGYFDDTVAYNMNIATKGYGHSWLSIAPYENSLQNKNVSITLETKNVELSTSQISSETYPDKDVNGIPTNVKALTNKSVSGRKFTLHLKKENEITFNISMPDYSMLDSLYLYFTNTRLTPTYCKIIVYNTLPVEQLEREYDFSNVPKAYLRCLSLALPSYALGNTKNANVKLILRFEKEEEIGENGADLGFSYLSGLIYNEVSGPIFS